MRDNRIKIEKVRTNILYLFAAVLLCSLFACALEGPSNIPPHYRNVPELENIPDSSIPSERKPVPVENLDESRSRTLSDIEVVWAIPDDSVEGYIITYGFDPSNMDRVIKLKSSNLEKFQDKNYGFVYRYVLSGIPLARTVYVSISAYNGTLVSAPSKIFKVTSG
jgi:predicted small lipoprotein YifL